MKEKKDLTTASTVRINISYTGKAPKIKFQSPNGSRISPEYFIWINIFQLAAMGTMGGMLICIVMGIENNLLTGVGAAWIINMIVLRAVLGSTFKKNLPDLMLGKVTAEYSKKWTKCSEDKVLEMPIFENIKMDYKATGEFAKYLKEIDIRELDFKCVKHNIMTGKYKKTKQDGWWTCRFYFSEVPKKGYLEAYWI